VDGLEKKREKKNDEEGEKMINKDELMKRKKERK
jgi:hypothetical protein